MLASIAKRQTPLRYGAALPRFRAGRGVDTLQSSWAVSGLRGAPRALFCADMSNPEIPTGTMNDGTVLYGPWPFEEPPEDFEKPVYALFVRGKMYGVGYLPKDREANRQFSDAEKREILEYAEKTLDQKAG
jgi:hypothetical protein